MTSSRSELALRPLPLAHKPYRHSRTPGAARTVAPSVPFSDTATVLDAIGDVGLARHPAGSHDLHVDCETADLERLASTLIRTGTAGMRTVVRIADLPDAMVGPAVVRGLAQAGVAAIEVREPIRAGAPLVDFIELAKAALAYGVPLVWSGTLPASEHGALVHLVPARNDTVWRERWRYAMLTWRRGPGFTLIDDVRDPHRRRSLTLALPMLTALFGELLDHPADVGAVEPSLRAELTAERLIAVLDSRAVWLPHRLLRGPVNAPPS